MPNILTHRILAVDDDVLSREVLSDLNKALGYMADGAVSGSEAIHQIQQIARSI